MKRLAFFLLTSTLFLVLLVASGGGEMNAGAQEGAPFNPHGSYSSTSNSCTTCHQPHVQSINPDAACSTCHPTVQSHRHQACSTCHEPHARTDNAALIQEVIWNDPVAVQWPKFRRCARMASV